MGAELHRMQGNPQTRQTGAAIAAHGVFRSGKGDSKMTEAGRRVPDLLRALSLLAKSVDGHTDTYLFACGISKALLAGLLRDGLATWSKPRAGIERPIDIVRVKITDAGRQALE